jgi:hypothetical protein
LVLGYVTVDFPAFALDILSPGAYISDERLQKANKGFSPRVIDANGVSRCWGEVHVQENSVYRTVEENL